MSSFIFQMHIRAEAAIENMWKSEHLPSLSFNKQINAARVVYLEGLRSAGEAADLAAAYLEPCRKPDFKAPSPTFPFTDEVIEAVWSAVNGNPRTFLESLFNILNQAELQGEKKIDLTFVQPLLDDVGEEGGDDEEDDDFSNPER
jgi:hypothetical protein